MRGEGERRWEVVGSETGDIISKRSGDVPRSWDFILIIKGF